MDLYERKMKACELIDQLAVDKTPLHVIYFKVETAFGMSQKFVNQRLEALEKINKSVLGYEKERIKIAAERGIKDIDRRDAEFEAESVLRTANNSKVK